MTAVETAFPGVTGSDGAIDRTKLGARVIGDPEALKRLEAVVHPLVGAHRAAFFREVAGAQVAVVDVPLLYETGGDRAVDRVVVVTCPPEMQRERVLARPGMTADKLDAILARQTPDADKRARADFVIDTRGGIEDARRQVAQVLLALETGVSRLRRGVRLPICGP